MPMNASPIRMDPICGHPPLLETLLVANRTMD